MRHKEFKELLQGVRGAGKVKRGIEKPSRIFVYKPSNVKEIRENVGLSQYDFSKLIHVSIKTLQNWEQGRRKPKGPALALLTILKNDPAHALKALH